MFGQDARFLSIGSIEWFETPLLDCLSFLDPCIGSGWHRGTGRSPPRSLFPGPQIVGGLILKFFCCEFL